MKCNRCGNPLPSEGMVCKFCGALMNQNQVNYQNKMKDKDNKRIVLLSEKYGHQNKIEYNDVKENKVLGIVIIAVVLLILILLAILLYI